MALRRSTTAASSQIARSPLSVGAASKPREPRASVRSVSSIATVATKSRCRLAARLLALFYNWWTIFVRLADPDRHREAITSQPLFLSAIATRTRHARHTTIRVTGSHAKAEPAAKALAAVAAFLRGLARNAEQLTRLQTWRAILSRAFQAFLNGRPLRPPPRLAPS